MNYFMKKILFIPLCLTVTSCNLFGKNKETSSSRQSGDLCKALRVYYENSSNDSSKNANELEKLKNVSIVAWVLQKILDADEKCRESYVDISEIFEIVHTSLKNNEISDVWINELLKCFSGSPIDFFSTFYDVIYKKSENKVSYAKIDSGEIQKEDVSDGVITITNSDVNNFKNSLKSKNADIYISDLVNFVLKKSGKVLLENGKYIVVKLEDIKDVKIEKDDKVEVLNRHLAGSMAMCHMCTIISYEEISSKSGSPITYKTQLVTNFDCPKYFKKQDDEKIMPEGKAVAIFRAEKISDTKKECLEFENE